MRATIKWHERMEFIATSESGHAQIIGSKDDEGNPANGPSPMELILMGVGGCSSIDVVHILKKARQPVEECICELSAERADAVPAVFTKIHLHFVVSGDGLSEKQVERAVALSAEKYCSASIMLQKACEITHSHEIR